MIAFARVFAETLDAGKAWRDTFRPATNPQPEDKFKGDSMLKVKYVQARIGEYLQPALVALGVDQTFAVRRLIETVDGDLTDYVKVVPSANGKDIAALMSLEDMRDALPLAKRRLVRKYKETYDQFGQIKSREIELEPKQPALELLAKIKGWVTGNTPNLVDADEMMRKIEEAARLSRDRAASIRGEFTAAATAGQLHRPATVLKLTAPQPAAEEPKKDG